MTDTRLIQDIPFAVDKRIDTDQGPKIVADEEAATRVRQILKAAGLLTDADIESHGCTGLFVRGVTLPDAAFVRARMAGSGMGLPCYVPPQRFCLVHNVIGGLQDGQEQRFADFVEDVSRELTKEEAKKVDFIEDVRRKTTRGSLTDRIAGAKERLDQQAEAERTAAIGTKPAWEPPTVRPLGNVEDLLNKMPALPSPLEDAVKLAQYGLMYGVTVPRLIDALKTQGQDRLAMVIALAVEADAWRCHEHAEVFWGCRFCVAGLVVKGELEPHLVRETAAEGFGTLLPEDADIAEFSETTTVYAKVATFQTKLVREP